MVNEIEAKIINYQHIVPKETMTNANKVEKKQRILVTINDNQIANSYQNESSRSSFNSNSDLN